MTKLFTSPHGVTADLHGRLQVNGQKNNHILAIDVYEVYMIYVTIICNEGADVYFLKTIHPVNMIECFILYQSNICYENLGVLLVPYLAMHVELSSTTEGGLCEGWLASPWIYLIGWRVVRWIHFLLKLVWLFSKNVLVGGYMMYVCNQ